MNQQKGKIMNKICTSIKQKALVLKNKFSIAKEKALNLIITKKDFFHALKFYDENPLEFEKILKDYNDKSFNPQNEIIMIDKNKPLIEMKDVYKKYKIGFKKERIVLDDVNFKINKGDFVALIGPNGAGKTTLVEMIVGFKKPTKGTIIYNYKYENFPTETMGVSFQKNNFLSSLTAWDYIIFTLRMYKATISIEELIIFVNLFGLKDQVKQKAVKLSGGQQQRLNAMLSLFHYPNIIFLDELCNNLDSNIKINIIKFVKEYIEKNKITGIIVSHDSYEIEQLASRIVGIKSGHIFLDLSKEEALEKYKTIHELLEKNI